MQLDFDFRPKRPPAEPVEQRAIAAAEPHIYTVAELTHVVRDLLEGGVGEVWVEGEVSNLRRQASGHQYFTLKDAASQIACVVFASNARMLGQRRLEDGMQVQVFGGVTVYEARGQYQLVVRLMQARGEGALQAKFQALKRKLAEEGLFDPARKRPLPRFPRRVGVVTSPTGAAIRDFLKVLIRRMPSIEIIINPVRVQGRGAAGEIVAAMREFSRAPANGVPEVDVIVVMRGGGSIEDLWEFNEEAVARSIVASSVPVVSAVGHEIDFTISDFAADLRAPTPSAAAEIIAPDASAQIDGLQIMRARMARLTLDHLRFLVARCDSLSRSALFREPERLLREKQQHLDSLGSQLAISIEQRVLGIRQFIENAVACFAAHQPGRQIELGRMRLYAQVRRLAEIVTQATRDRRHEVARLACLIEAMSPRAILRRGYTITTTSKGNVLKSAAEVTVGDDLVTVFADGRLWVKAIGAIEESD